MVAAGLGVISPMAVRRFETFLVFLPIMVGATFVGYATVSVHNASAQRNVEATNAGFLGSEDQDLAKASGFVDAGQWRAHVVATKADAEQKQKEWDAAAPQRAAAAAKEAADKVTRDANMKKAAAEGAERVRLATIPPGFRVSISGQSWKKGGFDLDRLNEFHAEERKRLPGQRHLYRLHVLWEQRNRTGSENTHPLRNHTSK